MQYAQNWYESGDLSVEEAAEAFRVIVQEAPYNERTCPNPAGGKLIRVSPNGRVEEYNDAGEWQEPTGDYAIPPVPERTGGTEQDQICLAAKNAAYSLQLLYENVTDSFNADLDAAEAETALVLGMTAILGAEFAPITFALVTFFSIVFGVLYGVLEFVGADLWDGDFTESLTCILVNCANNDAGVVTFDWECFNNALAAQVVVVDLTFQQLRLFGQIQYLLLVIGGVDALNAAGATTSITDDDCSYCGSDHVLCIPFDDDSEPYELLAYGEGTTLGTATIDVSFGNPDPAVIGSHGLSSGELGMGICVQVTLPAEVDVTGVQFDYNYNRNDATALYIETNWLDEDDAIIRTTVVTSTESQATWHTYTPGVEQAGTKSLVIRLAGSGGSFVSGDVWVDNICINYFG